MFLYNPETTWVGLLGGGFSGSLIMGGSIYQMDVWHMGSDPLPVRVIVKGRRYGAMAEVGMAMAFLLITGCRSAKEMEGITSSGIDWELSLGVRAGDVIKNGSELFNTLVNQAAKLNGSWAKNESAKRFVQWTMNDLGVVQPGRQFNLLPSPVGLSAGAGIFYDYQTMHLLGGKTGWQYMSPTWSVENTAGGLRFQMINIPEPDGELVRLGFSVPEWGFDPYIRWKKEKGDASVGEKTYHIEGYVYEGALYETRDPSTWSGINLSNFLPTGRLESGLTGLSNTQSVAKNGKLTVRPEVLQFGNYSYWSASDTMTVDVDGSGRFVKADGALNWKN